MIGVSEFPGFDEVGPRFKELVDFVKWVIDQNLTKGKKHTNGMMGAEYPGDYRYIIYMLEETDLYLNYCDVFSGNLEHDYFEANKYFWTHYVREVPEKERDHFNQEIHDAIWRRYVESQWRDYPNDMIVKEIQYFIIYEFVPVRTKSLYGWVSNYYSEVKGWD